MSVKRRSHAPDNTAFARDLARAFAGALIFAFPLLMTMEMWWLGFFLDPDRLLVLLLVTLVVLVPLSVFVGFERTGTFTEDVSDVFVAFAVGTLTATAMLALFGIIAPGMPASEILGKIAVQSVPASIGAMVARSQMGAQGDDTDSEKAEERAGYAGQLFIMLAGAVFLAFNVAPTEEMVLIAYMLHPWQTILLVLLSIALLHAFVFTLGFRGQAERPSGRGGVVRMSGQAIAGYGIAVIVSLYMLWTFGRIDGASLGQIATMVAVLGFPAALGAAAARLII